MAFATRTLVAFVVLLVGIVSPACADDRKAPSAILLSARAELPDPNFKDSVVLVMNNLGPVPAGVILNRPTRIGLSHLFPDLAHVGDKLYFGGPVEVGSVSFLFRADAPPEQATQVVDGVYFSTNRELLRTLLARDKPLEGLRVFVGYSGWAPGQLEAEIARGDWKVGRVDRDALFERKSEHPWPERSGSDVTI
jgi:putative transcriptional regulator